MNIPRSLLLLSALSIFTLSADFKLIWYKSPLSLVLVEEGVEAFLDAAKKQSDKEFNAAIHDVIEVADKNKTDVLLLLSQIRSALENRINIIERLQGKFVDTTLLIRSAGYMALGLALSYAIYCCYMQWYYPNSCEMDTIRKTLEQKGITIKYDSDSFGKIIKFSVPSNATNYYAATNRFTDLYNINNGRFEYFLGAVTLPCVAFFESIRKAIAGFNVNHGDDEYLDKYRALLMLTDELMTARMAKAS